MKKVLVTGASGLIGQHIVKKLLENGYYVYAIYNSTTPALFHINLEWYKVDLINNFFLSVDPPHVDILVHCAALIPSKRLNEEECYKINTLIDKRIFDYCNNYPHVKLLYASSIYIDNLLSQGLLQTSPYQLNKYESELFLSNTKFSYCILKISSPYGLGQKSNNVLKIFIEKALKGEDIVYYGSGMRTQDFISAKDIASAALAYIKSGLHQCTVNICSSSPISMKDLGILISTCVSKFSIKVLPSGKKDAQEDYRANFNNSEAKELLKWQPEISLATGINELIDHYR